MKKIKCQEQGGEKGCFENGLASSNLDEMDKIIEMYAEYAPNYTHDTRPNCWPSMLVDIGHAFIPEDKDASVLMHIRALRSISLASLVIR